MRRLARITALLVAGAAWAAPATGRPAATMASTGTSRIAHVVWILMENHGYASIVGSSQAPYINRLANTYGLATNYFALTHPSLPNYVALTSGSTQGITDDKAPSGHPLNVASIFSQLRSGQSRSLEESMPSACYKADSGQYVVHHNPMAYYTNLGTDCSAFDVQFAPAPDLSASFTFITPNSGHSMATGTIAQGDSFLSSYVPALMATAQYKAGNTAIFVTWDEDENAGANNHVAAIVISPYTSAVKSGTFFNHYSLLRTAEDLLGLPALGKAGTASSMESAFRLTVILAPSNTSLPTITGTTAAGDTLAASTGSWTNSPSAFAYQWSDCDASGANCVSISGATASTYTLTSADVGHTIRVLVKASNAGGSSSATSAPTATIAPAARDPIVVAVGDIACAPGDTSNDCRQAPTAALASAQHPDAVIPLGDNQYNSGLLSEYTGAGAYGATWGVFNPIAHPIPGNHEYTGSSTAAGYFGYFGASLGSSTASAPYYSYNLGTWHLVSLDSSCDDSGCADVVRGETSSAQTAWLQSDLAAHPSACTLAYWHHARFSASWTNDSPGTAPLFSALYNARADVVLSGHDHVYERYAQQDPTGAASTSGVRQFVAGTGGESLFSMLSTPPNLQSYDQNDFGVLVLTLHATSYSWAFKRLDGSIADSGTTACHGTAAATAAGGPGRVWPTGPTGPALRLQARVGPATIDSVTRRGLPVTVHLSRAANVEFVISVRRGRHLERIASFYATETQLPRPYSRILLPMAHDRLRGRGAVSLVIGLRAIDAAGHRRTLSRSVVLARR